MVCKYVTVQSSAVSTIDLIDLDLLPVKKVQMESTDKLSTGSVKSKHIIMCFLKMHCDKEKLRSINYIT